MDEIRQALEQCLVDWYGLVDFTEWGASDAHAYALDSVFGCLIRRVRKTTVSLCCICAPTAREDCLY